MSSQNKRTEELTTYNNYLNGIIPIEGHLSTNNNNEYNQPINIPKNSNDETVMMSEGEKKVKESDDLDELTIMSLTDKDRRDRIRLLNKTSEKWTKYFKKTLGSNFYLYLENDKLLYKFTLNHQKLLIYFYFRAVKDDESFKKFIKIANTVALAFRDDNTYGSYEFKADPDGSLIRTTVQPSIKKNN
jgi:hypothetical protein